MECRLYAAGFARMFPARVERERVLSAGPDLYRDRALTRINSGPPALAQDVASRTGVRNLRAVLSTMTAGLAVLAADAATRAQESLPGDPVAGRAFVRENCADCHDVERVWSELTPFYGPAFVDIAASPGLTATRLRAFLRTPHVEMPDFIFTEQEVDDIISYILTLKPGTGQAPAK
jgi:mono/diheme cytochrome c family protein